MARGGIEKPIGYETIWKDRDGRIRTKVKVAPEDREKYGRKDRNMIDKRVVVYLDNHKEETFEDLKNHIIIHLDGDTTNFNVDNLEKIPKNIFLLMLNNRMYFNDRELNKSSILVAKTIYEARKKSKNE